MSKSKDGGDVKSTLIVAEIAKRPILYDTTDPMFSERNKKSDAWIEVCTAVLPNWNSMSSTEKSANAKDIQKRWRSIRDSYTKQYRAGKCAKPDTLPPHGGGRRLQHQRQMTFLYNTLQRKAQRTSNEQRILNSPSPRAVTPTVTTHLKVQLDDDEPQITEMRHPSVDLTKAEENEDILQPKIEKIDDIVKDKNAERVNSKLETDVENTSNYPTATDCNAAEDNRETSVPACEDNIHLNILKGIQQDVRKTYRHTECNSSSLEIKIDTNTIVPEDNFDDDKLFMLSLLPFFKKMDDNVRLTCRIEILKILRNSLKMQLTTEGVKVKEEAKSSDELESPSSSQNSLRMTRKHKSDTQSESSEVTPRKRGRPRKNEWLPTAEEYYWERRMEERIETDRQSRDQRARKREEARTRTEDDEEIARATTATQLKQEKFFRMYNLKPIKRNLNTKTTPNVTVKKETS